MPLSSVEFTFVDGETAGQHLDELAALYTEVYAEPPYEWGDEHLALFKKRFAAQRQRDGFTLIEAREQGQLVAFGFGITLLPNAPWWQNLTTPVDEALTKEYPNRTFALVELLVRRPWRRQHVAETIHNLLLKDRIEERATLTVLPAAEAARAVYRKWGWQKVAEKRNPLPGSPVFEVMVKIVEKGHL
ncbi:MAG TPA: GNAT family N-acetyltransferase [Actinophytocola sp.]|uniref:GNAT family N-acetyltransferase n=1 Tax=Actinophytocola sp. TaxID=1872138 RepID=UPI002E049B0B|nr:GNAT family N-acetyltransferase [Actinophytocola sp.]